ncbi:MAG: acyloxyacyl hydrolase [Gammaproteobacteria bacterium]|nr:acyloxyacyl hydrolase [Gammaproteobacteria bacterium]
MPAFRLAVLVLMAALPVAAQAVTWQMATGVTLEEGGAVELSGRARRWEVAAGYVSEQQVLIHRITPVCPVAGAPAGSCRHDVRDEVDAVDPYAYLSVQRRFEYREGAWLRPQLGLGLVAQSDTNEYVSSAVNFSLSAGVALGERVALEWRHFSNAGTVGPNLGQDAVLLRWQFP